MIRFQFILQSYSKFNFLSKMTAVLLFFVILIGNLIHFIEPETFPTVFEGVWWSLVTISTVGYGDFVPETTFGRGLGIFLIILGITLFSFFITNLAGSTITIKQEREKGNMSYHKKGHYIIIGWNERSRQLIKQIKKYHTTVEIVMIDETLQQKPEDFSHVFIKGSPSVDETFMRANVKAAHTVIVTANLHVDEKVADANTVLTLLTLKGIHPTIYAIVELVTHLQIKNAERVGANEIIQSSKYLSRLMMNGVLAHGMTTVISEMLKHGKEEHLQFKNVPPELINESFQKAIEDCQSTDAFLMGIQRDNETILHPAKGSLLLKGDQLIFYQRK